MHIILERMQRESRAFMAGNENPPTFMPPITIEEQDEPLPDDLTEIPEIPFKHVNGETLYISALLPKKRPSRGKLPVAIYFHGGGLFAGNHKMCPVFRYHLAQLGYLVYSVDYRLVDRADALGMFADACNAFAFISKHMVQLGGDPSRVFVLGESAGAFVSRFAVACTRSRKLRQLYQMPDPRLTCRGVIFFSGMFYTTGMNPLGMVYQKDLFGVHLSDKRYMRYLQPDEPKIISLLPPVLLTSSKGDFLRSSTLRYAKALEKADHPYKLVYYADNKELSHAFPPLTPSLPESKKVLRMMDQWMKQL